MLAPLFETPNFAKLSYNKQRDIAMKKVEESDVQTKRTAKNAALNTMTEEEQIKEQERIFREARENML
jgi:hypothetical protein